MSDFLAYVIADAAEHRDSAELVWSVTFSDGQRRVGKIHHLGDTAYFIDYGEKFYFSSDKVLHIHLHLPTTPN